VPDLGKKTQPLAKNATFGKKRNLWQKTQPLAKNATFGKKTQSGDAMPCALAQAKKRNRIHAMCAGSQKFDSSPFS